MHRLLLLVTTIALVLAAPALRAQISWERAGSGIDVIDVTSMCATPSGAVLAGISDGIYRSSNGGVSWYNVSTASSARIAIDSAGSAYAIGRNGTYRSTDNGTTWTRVSNLSDAFQLEAAPDGRVYAITAEGAFALFGDEPVRNLGLQRHLIPFTRLAVAPSGDVYVATSTDGVLRSTDDGATWTTFSARMFTAFAIAPDGTLFGGSIVATTMRTVDGEGHWAAVAPFVPGEFSFGPYGEILVTVPDEAQGGLRISTDVGGTWRTMTDVGPRPNADMAVMTRNGVIIRKMNGLLYRSVNLGEKWTPAVDGIMAGSAEIPTVAALPDGALFAEVPADIIGNPQGVSDAPRSRGLFSSTDDGTTWSRVPDAPGGTGLEVKGSAIFLSTARIGLSMNNDAMVSRSTIRASFDRGATWTGGFESDARRPAAAGPGGRYVVGVFDRQVNRLQTGGLRMTSDAGKSWSEANLPEAVAWASFTPGGNLLAHVVDAPVTGTTLYDTYQLRRSTDDGIHWTTVLDSVDAGRIVSDAAGRMFVVIRDFVDTTITSAGLFRSTDDGVTWEQVNRGPRELEQTTFLTPEGTLYFGRWRTTDGGDNWFLVPGMKDVVDSLIVTSDGRFIALVDGAISISSDGGNTWSPAMTGLPGPIINSVAVGRGGRLFVSTSAGVFRSAVTPAAVPSPSSGEAFTLGVSPNPFSGVAHLKLHLDRAAGVRVDLVDPLGRIVAVPFEGGVGAGEHAIPIDAEGLAAGIYLCRMTTSAGYSSATVVKVR